MRLLFIGGCKSGKSSAAQRIAKLLGENAPLYYWATMEPHDDEDLARIRRHIADRDGWGFTTVDGIFTGGEAYDPWTAAYVGGLSHICRTLAAEFDVVCEMTMGLPHVWKGALPRA